MVSSGGAAASAERNTESVRVPVTVVAEPYSSQNSSKMDMRTVRSTCHCVPASTWTMKRMSTVHGMPTVAGGVTSTAGWTSSSPMRSSAMSSFSKARRVAASARAAASAGLDEPRRGTGMTMTARDQKLEVLIDTRAVEFGMMTVSCFRVRI